MLGAGKHALRSLELCGLQSILLAQVVDLEA